MSFHAITPIGAPDHALRTKSPGVMVSEAVAEIAVIDLAVSSRPISRIDGLILMCLPDRYPNDGNADS